MAGAENTCGEESKLVTRVLTDVRSRMVLCKNRQIYQWSDPRTAICDVRRTHEERPKADN